MQAAARCMSEAYARRRDLVLALCAAAGSSPIRFPAPQGAFYCFVDIRELKSPSASIAERLLEECAIAMAPGSAYGSCGEGFLRMTIAASEAEIEAGVRGLLEWAACQRG
jgi:aspartate/methionine/tyrosine aminotransferase